ncbi:MAG: ABC transporter permease, partial [Methanosarcinales archaeon]
MKNKKVFLFITLAIAFATANIIIINGFMDGFSNDLVDSAIESSTGHLNIYPKEGDRFIDGLGIKEKKLSSINGIIAYSPRLHSSGTLSHEGKSKSVKIVALDPVKDRRVTNILDKLDNGYSLSRNDQNNILISFHLAEDLHSEVGDSVKVVFENGKTKVYKVKGIMHTGSPEIDKNTIFINLDEATRQLPTNKASIILIKLSDIDLAEEYKEILRQELGVNKIKIWNEEVEYIASSMDTFKQMTNTVIAVGLFAAAVSVGIIIYVNVVYKRRQIGIMKAIGMKNSLIFSVYILEAMLLGIIGIVFGDLLGYFGTKYLEANPF